MDSSHHVLAIIAPNPDTVSETYVRQHIQLICPQKTVVVYFAGEGNSVRNIPSLKIENSSESGVIRKLHGLFNLIRHGYAGALRGRQKTAVIDFFKEHRVSCVLAEFGQVGCKIKAPCQALGLPLFVFFHGQDAGVGSRTFKRKYSYWRLGNYVSKVFAPSKCFSQKVVEAGIPSKKIHVAPHGLSIQKFSAASKKDPHLLLTVGRMVEKKAPHLTVGAFAKVLSHVPDARLEMIGDGDFLERARTTARELGVDQQIVFHGAKDHTFVMEKMRHATVFMQHSVVAANGDTESFGISLLEAMACEVPVVSTRHNGFVDTVEEGMTGFLVEERDVDSMADRVVEILKNNELRDRMGKASRVRVEKYFEETEQCALLSRLMGISE
jgi:glycosyltransferase involved in cell wall biosynthesis